MRRRFVSSAFSKRPFLRSSLQTTGGERGWDSRMMTSGQLRAILVELNFNSADLARAIGRNRTTVRRWIRGEFPISPEGERGVRIMLEDYRRITLERRKRTNLWPKMPAKKAVDRIIWE